VHDGRFVRDTLAGAGEPQLRISVRGSSHDASVALELERVRVRVRLPSSKFRVEQVSAALRCGFVSWVYPGKTERHHKIVCGRQFSV
jgi:hypothetical protein